jgi:hypothetical protein
MLVRLALLVAAIGLALWGTRWWRRTPPGQRQAVLRQILLWGGGSLLLILVVTGRINPVLAAVTAAIPVIVRVLSLLQLLPMLRQALRGLGLLGPDTAAGAQASSIRTRFLDMSLDLASGQMDGLVREGPRAGQRLADLGLDDLLDLLGLCRSQDPQSEAVLRAYLDRERPEWQDHWQEQPKDQAGSGPGEAGSPRGQAAMDRAEALRILGLAEDAGPEAVREAHRRLMQRFHPDRGGSDYLAAMINQAKRVLLGE